MSMINTTSVNMLGKLMDGLWKRQEAISENIANIDTPNYRRKTVSFENDLVDALKANSNDQINSNIENTEIAIKKDSNHFYTADNNGVDVDKENLELAKTTIQYQYAVRSLNDNFSRLRFIINEGRR